MSSTLLEAVRSSQSYYSQDRLGAVGISLGPERRSHKFVSLLLCDLGQVPLTSLCSQSFMYKISIVTEPALEDWCED